MLELASYFPMVSTFPNGIASCAVNDSVSPLGSVPINTVVPTITGTKRTGQTLTEAHGTYTTSFALTYAYQWQVSDNGTAGWSDIGGATSQTYVISSSYAGKYLRVAETATNDIGAGTVAYSAATTQILSLPANPVLPTITGTVLVGQTLTEHDGTWTGVPTPTFTYQWQSNPDSGNDFGWSDIGGATANTYIIVVGDLLKYLRVVVVGTNSVGSNTSTSDPTAQILS